MQKLSDYNYNLPDELIAVSPEKQRDHSRLLVLDKLTGQAVDKYFFDIVDYLHKGDVLVMNNSKVFPARLLGRKKGTGGKVEIFLHKKIKNKNDQRKEKVYWECLVGGKNIKTGKIILFKNDLQAEIIANNKDGTWLVAFNKLENEMMEIVEQIGQVPLPPYIKRDKRIKKINDKEVYQTIYADDDKLGSVAAPTAGFHFTSKLIKKIKDMGVKIEYITLHVGLGTFAPVKTDDITNHKMHAEYVEIGKQTMQNIARAKQNKKRIITVGTTSTRALEAYAMINKNWQTEFRDFADWVNIFIYPSYKFQIIDAMITNFHLPKSSLIMLVSALAGKENIKKAYEHAIYKKYRFYSYGDAMFIK